MTTKLFADSNRASLREVVELTTGWGDTPTSGISRSRRFTQSALEVKKDTAVSDEIRDDRMVSDIVETGASSGGDISWEFSAGNQDLDLQRVLMGTWSRPMTFDFFRGNVAITANNTITINGDDYSGYLTVGRRIKLSGFVNPANNTYAEIATIVVAGTITTVTTTSATLVAEGSSVFTTLQDANDVIVRANTTVSFANATISGVGVFADALAAQQLVPAQRIFVEGIGYGVGSITIDFMDLMDDMQVVISDGVNAFTFESQNNSEVKSDTDFTFEIGADATTTGDNLAAVINALRPNGSLLVSAVNNAGVVTVTNLRKSGGLIETSDAGFTVVTFAGGDATVGGLYSIVSVTADAIVVDRNLPTLAAGAKITIKGAILRNPSKSSDIVSQSMSIETGFNDVSQYFLTDGLRAGGFTLDITSGAIIKGSTTTMGAATNRSNATVLGNATVFTVLDATATENVSATANVGALSIDGEEVSTALQAISLKVDGSLRNQMAVGSKFPVGIAAGRLNITGTLNAYFADGTNYDRFINHDTVALGFPVIDQDDNTYYFTIPAFKITSDPIAPGGNDQDVMEKLDFTAFRDAATKCMIQIDRFSATSPITAL